MQYTTDVGMLHEKPSVLMKVFVGGNWRSHTVQCCRLSFHFRTFKICRAQLVQVSNVSRFLAFVVKAL